MKRMLALIPFTISTPLLSLLCLTIVLLTISRSHGGDEKTADRTTGDALESVTEEKRSDADQTLRVPLSVARDRAVLMHQIYTTTLEVMHDRYFHADRSVVPARAMEDVFENLERQTGSQAKWISVNLKAMSINHDPETDFEKQAARELGLGNSEYELADNGVYRRATPIPLHGGCVSCHAGFNPKPSKTPKVAGLVISIPLIDEEALQP
jgi:hypothetical protein